MDIVADLFQRLYDATGLNFTVFYDGFDRDRFFRGLWTTIHLSGLTILISIAIGVVGAGAQRSPFALVRAAVNGYVVLFRNTPPLVQLYFFYFGLGTLLPAALDASGARQPFLGNVQWAVISLSLFAGAFNVEIFRSGVEAVPTTTVEAAEALGYTRLSAYAYIVLPLALRVCLPALNNNLVNLLKTTTLAYAIAVPETLYAVKQIWSESQNVPEMMALLLVTYFGLAGMLVWLMHRWERALAVPGFGR